MSWVDRLHDGVVPARFHTHRSTGCSQVPRGGSSETPRPAFPPCAPTNARHRSPRPLDAAGTSRRSRPSSRRSSPSTARSGMRRCRSPSSGVDVAVVAGADDYATGSAHAAGAHPSPPRIPPSSHAHSSHAADAHPDGFDGQAVRGGRGAAPRREWHDLARRAGGAARRRVPRAAAAVRERAGDLRAAVPADGVLPHRPDAACAGIPKEQQAACSYCLRYLTATPTRRRASRRRRRSASCGTAAGDRERHVPHLLSMRAGIKDYYYDTTQWLYRTVMGSTRDVEPLGPRPPRPFFLFAPGATGVVPPGVPGAGQTVARGAYSTNGLPSSASPSPARSGSTTGRSSTSAPWPGATSSPPTTTSPSSGGHLPDLRQGGESVLGPHAGRRRRATSSRFPTTRASTRTPAGTSAPRRATSRASPPPSSARATLLSPASVAGSSRSTRSPTASPRTASRTALGSRRCGRRSRTGR